MCSERFVRNKLRFKFRRILFPKQTFGAYYLFAVLTLSMTAQIVVVVICHLTGVANKGMIEGLQSRLASMSSNGGLPGAF